MATNNSVNSPLSGTTGTGNFVGSTSPTITTPRIAQINDTNGNANIATTGPVSPVNYWTSVSSVTGGLTGLEVTGTDTNANGYIKAKGDAGIAIITSAVAANPLYIYSGTAQQHLTAFAFSNTAQTRVVTFPDATGTVAFNSVAYGGTGVTSTTAYAVLCGGTTSTGALQSVASVGTSGQVLTSNGAGALPTFQGGLFKSIVQKVFTSSGTYTPTSGMAFCVVYCIGAGGSGGGSSGATGANVVSCGGGGGSGALAISTISASTIGASQTVTIGTGGAGVTGAAGNGGGQSSLGSLVVANGGGGGDVGGTANNIVRGGGGGGSSYTGDYGTIGQPGSYSIIVGAGQGVTGGGGNTIFGSGGKSIGAVGNGEAGTNGGGGSGGLSYNAGAAYAGGAGGNGLIVIYEYIIN